MLAANTDQGSYEIGMAGLGVMGLNLALNIAEHGFSVAGYDLDAAKVQALGVAGAGMPARGVDSLPEFIRLLRRPRAVWVMVPAGPAVDAAIQSLTRFLEPGDLLIDGGNSHFTDTDVRMKALAASGIQFLGVGVSGGAHGARYGPSLMPGGPREAYERVRPILEAIAAREDGQPCVTYIGPGSAGHYVKMVHNGIEYALMQLIAESYDLMRRGLGLNDDELHTVYADWNRAELESYLIEITADIFCRDDAKSGRRLIDLIRPAARQLGTGRWAAQDAMDLQVPIPTLAVSVSMRDLSAEEEAREAAAQVLTGPAPAFSGERAEFIGRVKHALYAGMVIAFAQGMSLLHRASTARKYDLNLEEIARIWRGGCIIRAALLKKIQAAYQASPALISPILDPELARETAAREADLRAVVCSAGQWGLPAPALMASLAYFDTYRSTWLPANLIQAQRDYFGAHTYERTDQKGIFHTDWEEG